MDPLENIFPSDNETVEKLKGFAYKLDYPKILFEHLGPELKKIFDTKKDKSIYKNFLEALSYEYGLFGKKMDLSTAFSLYKKYADLNDYFCMYRMHIIYLCDYDKFNVAFNRVLEKIYLLKCFAYLPNYIIKFRLELFDKVDILYEVALVLDSEYCDFEKYEIFFDLLNNEREKYNLSENDINLIEGCLFCFFRKKDDDQEFNLLLFSILNSITQKNENDFAYYNARNKSIFFRDYLDLKDFMTELEIEKIYEEIKEKKLYEFYNDYGKYLLDKNNKANNDIIEIFTTSSNNGYSSSSFKAYQSLIDFYEFNDIMNDYNKISTLLNYLLDEIVFEKLSLSQFILLMGYTNKHSKYKEKINLNYLPYVKEINNYINSILEKKEKENISTYEEGKDEFFFIIKGYFLFFSFDGIEEKNYNKSIEYLDKGINITKKNWVKKMNEFFKFNIIKEMNNLNLISNEELIKAKHNLFDLISKNLNLKYSIIDCYISGLDYFEGITRKKDEFIALNIYKSALNIFCGSIISCPIKTEIKNILKNHEYKIENKLNDETCCICYDKKVNKIFIPCKHYFCSTCTEKIGKDSKCPICRSDILCII